MGSVFGYEHVSFGESLRTFNEGDALLPTGTAVGEGINWWNFGTDLQVDKKAQFVVNVKWEDDVLCTGTGELVVLKTADSIHPIHSDATGTIQTPVVYKDGWFYAVAE